MKREVTHLFVVASSLAGMTPMLLAQENVPCRPLVSTTGSAEIRVVPDLADLVFQVEARNTDLTKARTEQAERMSKVLATLRNAGAKDSELQTSQVEIVPHYENDNRGGGPFFVEGRPVESAAARFFSVSQSVSCTLHDVKKIANVTADAVTAGVTGIQGASLRTSELRKYRDQARSQAIRAAKEKAVALAGELGAKVGRPFTITENQYYGGSQMFNSGNYQRSASASGNDSGEPNFAPGTISVSAHVSVSFALE
jgi:uncharacterized protein YggE